MTKTLPPFTEVYEEKGNTLALNSGTPIKERVIRDTLAALLPAANLQLMTYAGFWIMEAVLVQYNLDSDQYPTLFYYLEHRKGTIEERWHFYTDTVQSAELDLLQRAYEATRRNLYETLADVSTEEKKS